MGIRSDCEFHEFLPCSLVPIPVLDVPDCLKKKATNVRRSPHQRQRRGLEAVLGSLLVSNRLSSEK